MRIHSDKLSTMHIINALNDEKAAGRIAHSVGFKLIEKKGSRSHALAFEIQLESYQKVVGDGRRMGNSGSYGAGEDFAATYDEWGFFLAAVFAKDPDAVAGSVARPVYEGQEDFHAKTGYSYSPELVGLIETAHHDPYPFVTGKNSAGRRGSGRSDGESLPSYVYDDAVDAHAEGRKPAYWATYAPRTAKDVQEFRKEA